MYLQHEYQIPHTCMCVVFLPIRATHRQLRENTPSNICPTTCTGDPSVALSRIITRHSRSIRRRLPVLVLCSARSWMGGWGGSGGAGKYQFRGSHHLSRTNPTQLIGQDCTPRGYTRSRYYSKRTCVSKTTYLSPLQGSACLHACMYICRCVFGGYRYAN